MIGIWKTNEGLLKLIDVDVNKSNKAIVRLGNKRKKKVKVKQDNFKWYIVWEGDRYYLDNVYSEALGGYLNA